MGRVVEQILIEASAMRTMYTLRVSPAQVERNLAGIVSKMEEREEGLLIQGKGERERVASSSGSNSWNLAFHPSCFPFPPRWAESIRVPIRDFQSSVKVASHEPSNERGIKTGRKITQQKRTEIKHLKKCWRSYRNRIGKLNCRAGLEDSGSKKFYVHRREIN